MSRSIEATQDRVLGSFQKALRTTIKKDVVTDAIERAKKSKMHKAKQAKQAKQANDSSKTTFGMTVKKTETARKKFEKAQALEELRITESLQNRDRHSLLLSVIDLFDDDREVNAENLAHMQNISEVLIDTNELTIVLNIKKCQKYALKFNVETRYTKEFFAKSDNYDVDKKVVKKTKEVETSENFTAKYGKVTTFRTDLLKPFVALIKQHNIQDASNQNDDAWEF